MNGTIASCSNATALNQVAQEMKDRATGLTDRFDTKVASFHLYACSFYD